MLLFGWKLRTNRFKGGEVEDGGRRYRLSMKITTSLASIAKYCSSSENDNTDTEKHWSLLRRKKLSSDKWKERIGNEGGS